MNTQKESNTFLSALLKPSNSKGMDMEKLNKLSREELTEVKNKNYVLFHLIILINLFTLYNSVASTNIILLFLSIGVAIAAASLYDNYRFTRELLKQA